LNSAEFTHSRFRFPSFAGRGDCSIAEGFFIPLVPVVVFALLSYSVVRILWWFLILGISTVVVVSVAISILVRVRRQMKSSTAVPPEARPIEGQSSPPEA
jgi:hypothetical protein